MVRSMSSLLVAAYSTSLLVCFTRTLLNVLGGSAPLSPSVKKNLMLMKFHILHIVGEQQCRSYKMYSVALI